MTGLILLLFFWQMPPVEIQAYEGAKRARPSDTALCASTVLAPRYYRVRKAGLKANPDYARPHNWGGTSFNSKGEIERTYGGFEFSRGDLVVVRGFRPKLGCGIELGREPIIEIGFKSTGSTSVSLQQVEPSEPPGKLYGLVGVPTGMPCEDFVRLWSEYFKPELP